MIIIFLAILAVIIVYLIYSRRLEGYNLGTIDQLVAKDVQDTNLTDDAWKYLYYPTGPYRKKYFNHLSDGYYSPPYIVGYEPYFHYMYNYPEGYSDYHPW